MSTETDGTEEAPGMTEGSLGGGVLTTPRAVSEQAEHITLDEPTFDADGYPTEETLQTIREWPMETPGEAERLLAYVERAWSHYGVFRRAPRLQRRWRGSASRERRYRLVTGGWSGNEDIIRALDDNLMFTALCWESSSRGGAHEYRVASR